MAVLPLVGQPEIRTNRHALTSVADRVTPFRWNPDGRYQDVCFNIVKPPMPWHPHSRRPTVVVSEVKVRNIDVELANELLIMSHRLPLKAIGGS